MYLYIYKDLHMYIIQFFPDAYLDSFMYFSKNVNIFLGVMSNIYHQCNNFNQIYHSFSNFFVNFFQ